MATSEGRVGPVPLGDGSQGTLRLERTGGLVVAQNHGDFTEAASRGFMYSMFLAATSGTVAAGNIIGAAAAASTQFALFNPIGSGKNINLIRFNYGIISGTPTGGQIAHGVFTGGVPTLAANGTIRNNFVNGPGSVAIGYASAAGAALTGGTVGPVPLLGADFSNTATAQATTGTVGAAGYLHGLVVLPPGTGWAPLHPGAGTTHLSSYSITWEEIPV